MSSLLSRCHCHRSVVSIVEMPLPASYFRREVLPPTANGDARCAHTANEEELSRRDHMVKVQSFEGTRVARLFWYLKWLLH